MLTKTILEATDRVGNVMVKQSAEHWGIRQLQFHRIQVTTEGSTYVREQLTKYNVLPAGQGPCTSS